MAELSNNIFNKMGSTKTSYTATERQSSKRFALFRDIYGKRKFVEEGCGTKIDKYVSTDLKNTFDEELRQIVQDDSIELYTNASQMLMKVNIDSKKVNKDDPNENPVLSDKTQQIGLKIFQQWSKCSKKYDSWLAKKCRRDLFNFSHESFEDFSGYKLIQYENDKFAANMNQYLSGVTNETGAPIKFVNYKDLVATGKLTYWQFHPYLVIQMEFLYKIAVDGFKKYDLLRTLDVINGINSISSELDIIRLNKFRPKKGEGMQYKHYSTFEASMIEKLRNKEKIVDFWSSKNKGIDFQAKLLRVLPKIKYYHADADSSLDKDLQDVDERWKMDCIMYTSKVTVGVNFTVPDHFSDMFVFGYSVLRSSFAGEAPISMSSLISQLRFKAKNVRLIDNPTLIKLREKLEVMFREHDPSNQSNVNELCGL
ncbi:hypothetical protein BDK51DRAFT_33018 [Blyttiomyces helicus]|uniref:Uncharacterized protein n=1 Tax=Blyttiomyces helicus TaxID=388810 RepID=A0A4P9WMB4_9FUNG|nr:hypothetical protein BDK51DRAFT_33018 [Blyttiomyces helicus]|eukprot:RKO91856.1 hypothetical protein BDK51DRAFT_33018 [Blyttiomyces helicus]